MQVKTAILVATAAAAFAGASIVAVTSSKAWERPRAERSETSRYGIPYRGDDRGGRHYADRYRHLPRVTANGDASGRLPHALKQWQARREAIENWRDKVASRFGSDYSRWFAARNKDVDCDAKGKGEVRCVVSATPARGGWRIGGY